MVVCHTLQFVYTVVQYYDVIIHDCVVQRLYYNHHMHISKVSRQCGFVGALLDDHFVQRFGHSLRMCTGRASLQCGSVYASIEHHVV